MVKKVPKSLKNKEKMDTSKDVHLVGVFITDLILMAIRQTVETYSRTAEKVCIYKAFFERKEYEFMEKYIIENGIKYELRGEQYYPMLEVSEEKEHQIVKYGLLHRDYIKQHKRGSYTTLLTEGRLNEHLHEIDLQANEMVEAIVANLARERGIDEELKASDVLKWVAEMNNIKASAEEIVLREVIYQ